jgi:hypothetical protein
MLFHHLNEIGHHLSARPDRNRDHALRIRRFRHPPAISPAAGRADFGAVLKKMRVWSVTSHHSSRPESGLVFDGGPNPTSQITSDGRIDRLGLSLCPLCRSDHNPPSVARQLFRQVLKLTFELF